MFSWRRSGPAILFVMGVIGLLEILCRTGVIANYIFASPTDVFQAIVEEPRLYRDAFFATLLPATKGLILSFIMGLSLAAGFSLSSWLKQAVLPFCIFFQTVPVVALAPLMVIWFGFGEPTVLASAAVVSFFPILANALLGFNSVTAGHRDLFRLMGASRFQTLWRLEFPTAIPSILAGLQIAAGLAVIGAIVGEFVGGGGLGGLIDSARSQQKTEVIFAAVLLSSILGFLLVRAVDILTLALARYQRKS